jgi:GNAT superfamily N-acetyltransferase
LTEIRYGRPSERKALENLQLRASTVWPEYRRQILQHPDSIDLPPNLLAERRVRVAQTEETPVGFSVLLAPNDRVSELDGLFVEPAQWHHGIGTALLRDAAEFARAEDAVAIEVTANPLAREFYEKFGFTHIGETSTRFGPALRMRYSLRVNRPGTAARA